MAERPADRRASPRAASAGLGLAGRPGQRRAVRLTAVALGLLALAVGVRDALVDDPAGAPRPAGTAPATPQEPQSERGGDR